MLRINLDVAIRRLNPNLLRYALELGRDPNIKFGNERTSPLLQLIKVYQNERREKNPEQLKIVNEKCIEMIKTLLEFGAKTVSEDKTILSILREAISTNNPDIINLIATEENINVPFNELGSSCGNFCIRNSHSVCIRSTKTFFTFGTLAA